MEVSILIVLVCLVSYSSQIGPLRQHECPVVSNPMATTPNLRDIFIGRCRYFLNVLHATNCDIVASNYNCNDIWVAFRTAIVGKKPCEVRISDFDAFLALVDHPIPANKSIFWSGTYTPSHEYTKQFGFWSLEDTFAGYLLNELTFCSAANLTDFSTTDCPLNCGLRNMSFWNAASLNFAKKSSGMVTIILNGTRTIGAIANTSTFLNYELPEFKSDRIKKVSVYLLTAPGMAPYETCTDRKTLKVLENSLSSKYIPFECIDNPEEIVYFMCFQNPLSRECDFIKNTVNTSSSIPKKNNLTVYLLLLAFLTIFKSLTS